MRVPRLLTVRPCDELLGVDADRAGDRLDGTAADRHVPVGADRAAHFPLDVIVKGFEPLLRLKSHHVVAEQCLHQPTMLRQGDQQAGWWPGDVKEKAEPVGDPLLAQHPAQRHHVIIMHPDQIVGLDMRTDHLAEQPIDPLISALEITLELGQPEPIVEQWP